MAQVQNQLSIFPGTVGTSWPLARPSAALDDHVVVVTIGTRNASSTVTPPAGWVLLQRDATPASTGSTWLYVGRAGSVTWGTWSASATSAFGLVGSYNAKSDALASIVKAISYAAGVNSIYAAPSVNVASAESLALFFESYSAGTVLNYPASPFVGRIQLVGGSGQSTATNSSGDEIVSVGATGVRNFVSSGGSTGQNAIGTSIVLEPVASAGPVAPATPTGLTGTVVGQNQIDISWTASSGATSHELLINGATLVTGLTTSYSHTGLNPSTTVSYQVRARNSAGASSYTTAISRTTDAAPAANPKISTLVDPLNDMSKLSATASGVTLVNGALKHTLPSNSATTYQGVTWSGVWDLTESSIAVRINASNATVASGEFCLELDDITNYSNRILLARTAEGSIYFRKQEAVNQTEPSTAYFSGVSKDAALRVRVVSGVPIFGYSEDGVNWTEPTTNITLNWTPNNISVSTLYGKWDTAAVTGADEYALYYGINTDLAPVGSVVAFPWKGSAPGRPWKGSGIDVFKG